MYEHPANCDDHLGKHASSKPNGHMTSLVGSYTSWMVLRAVSCCFCMHGSEVLRMQWMDVTAQGLALLASLTGL